MGRFERRPKNPRSNGDPSTAAQTALKAVTEDLQVIQRNLLKSLREDIKRLEREKIRLADDIRRLQEEKEQLQQGRDLGEIQALVRQVAQVLANHLSTQLQSSLESLANRASGVPSGRESNLQLNTAESEQSNAQLLDTLQGALTISLSSLQQEINNYQSSISQQLSRMYDRQQQGEVILTELVERLRVELEGVTEDSLTLEVSSPPIEATPSDLTSTEEEESPFEIHPNSGIYNRSGDTKLQNDLFPDPNVNPIPAKPIPAKPIPGREVSPEEIITPPPPPQSERSESLISPSKDSLPAITPSVPPQIQRDNIPQGRPTKQTTQAPKGLITSPTGLILIFLSSLVSALYNLIIKIIVQPNSEIFGVLSMESLMTPTLGNSMLLLMLRMLVVVPLMFVLAPILHPRVWQDLQNLIKSFRGKASAGRKNSKRLLILSIVSGSFLFLSQVLTYIALGQIPTGMATSLIFIYPVVSGLLSWFLFRDRPSPFRVAAMCTIGFGQLLLLVAGFGVGIENVTNGSSAAFGAGIAFAFYIIFTRICAAKLHPISFTAINFCTMLVLSFIGLIIPLPVDWGLEVNQINLFDLILISFALGVMTILGYLLNNFGVRKLGATRAGVFGAIVPVLTVICAGIIIQEELGIVQIIGVLLITFGVAAFSLDKIKSQPATSRSR
ncbi:EamA family transporter [Mastigocoleus sp. MO_188.B34]|uniref:DMT family transporter n=1 Tax=Mastigocoleus sp. MO_188.B34 TaxID=3036635 RepID=UPI0026033D7D|nr:EamA family transporter [Mastigocoleus sp. MO_188.B34]MDJ0693658.1 EamA family transporter [Mastigocoleus sp. MO_188.B34]